MAIETRFGGNAKREGALQAKQYDLAEFARRYGLTAVKAQEILQLAGSDRDRADQLARLRRPAVAD